MESLVGITLKIQLTLSVPHVLYIQHENTFMHVRSRKARRALA